MAGLDVGHFGATLGRQLSQISEQDILAVRRFDRSLGPPRSLLEAISESERNVCCEGLDGRARCDSQQVFEALPEISCGPRPPVRNIALQGYAMKVTWATRLGEFLAPEIRHQRLVRNAAPHAACVSGETDALAR